MCHCGQILESLRAPRAIYPGRFTRPGYSEPGMGIAKLATWIPVTHEALADAGYMRLVFEYSLTGANRPLSLRERVTGWRLFTSTEGLTAPFRVGWRRRLHLLLHPPVPVPDDPEDC